MTSKLPGIILSSACILLSGCKTAPVAHEQTVRTPPTPFMKSYTFETSVKGTNPTEAAKEKLLVRSASEDEQAVGPNSFDIGDDGTILVSDPVRERIAVFKTSADNKVAVYKSEFNLSFAGILKELGPLTARVQSLELDHGKNISNAKLGVKESDPELAAEPAVLSGNNQAVVSRTFQDKSTSPLKLGFIGAGEDLVSIAGLGTDQYGYTFCLLEIGRPGNQIDVRRVIRKYAKDGRLAAEIANIPEQQDISPVKEFTVRSGVVYQMVVGKSGTILNHWDLNEFR
jgi:hypothetical protein